jgi:membrane fusion protein, multidrug efflux system
MNKNYLLKYTGILIIAGLLSCSSENSNVNTAESETERNSENIQKAVPVEVLVIKEKILERTLSLTGTLEPVHAVDIVAEVSGKVLKINKKLGNKVSPDDILAVIDYKIPLSQYEQAKAQVLMAENNLHIAKLNLKSDKELYENGDISELEYQNSNLAIKTAEANLLSAKANLSLTEKTYQDTRIKSPFSGLISREYIELGMMVNPNTPVYKVVDLKELKISLGIPQDIIKSVNTSSRATVSISALNNEKFPAKVKFTSPQADPSTGAFETEVYVSNTPDMKIKGGMTAKVDLILDDIGKQTAVPDYAIILKNDQHMVYKYKKGLARLTNVTIGSTFGNNIVITKGIVPGDTIVVTGMKNLGVDTRVFIEQVQEYN